MTHTKEPWATTKAKPRKVHADGVLICTALLRNMATTAHNHHGKGVEEATANAARIVSCVNALAGIPDPAAFVQAARGMAEALSLFNSFGCPHCNGDCGSANPPVLSCPMQIGSAALAAFREQMGEAQ